MNSTIIHLAEIDSTQTFLRRHPELGFCAVVADTQTQGRGRQGNTWISAPGAGLWMSAAMPQPDLSPGIVLQKAMLGVIAAIVSLSGCGVELGLKWPNDLAARKAGRLVKLGGIIGEKAGERLILGLGINLSSAPALDGRVFPAASLAEMTMTIPESGELARRILSFWKDLNVYHSPAFLWPEAGTPIQWEQGQGVVMGWEADGRLKVTTSAGIERLSAAEIQGLGPTS